MRKLQILAAAIMVTFTVKATTYTVEEDFNHGCEWISKINCWKFCYMDVVKNKSYGCYSYGTQSGMAQTWYLGSYCSYAKLYSPYTYFNGSGNVTFKHKLSSNSGKYRRLRAYLIDANGQLGAKIFDHTYINNYNSNGNVTSTQTATIPVTWTGVYKVKWYWSGYKGYSRGIIDDIVIDGMYSTSVWCWCKPIIPNNPPCTDSDGDGCCDNEDMYPNDPAKCDGYFVPAEDQYNTVAYEDLWPCTGDFDFNDMVVDRYSEYGLNSDGDVVDVTHKIVVRAVGASYFNGFGINMPAAAPSDVASVTGTMVNPGNYTSLNANGTEANQTTAVVIGFENWKDVTTKTVNGLYMNTVPSGGEGYSDTIVIHIEFANPQLMDDEGLFDPFLIKKGDRSQEVHLPWFGPTDLVDMTKFNTCQDKSSTNAFGNHYVTVNNTPWAIYTPVQAFEYPTEYTDITTAYYHFADWASSNGTTYTDWYLVDSPTYRDNSKLY